MFGSQVLHLFLTGWICLQPGVLRLTAALEGEHDAHVPTPLPSECENDNPLGMISGTIANWQITASSTYPSSWAKGCSEHNARPFRPNGLAWCAKFKSSSEWLQIDLGVRALVRLIIAVSYKQNLCSSYLLPEAVIPHSRVFCLLSAVLAVQNASFEGPKLSHQQGCFRGRGDHRAACFFPPN
ncbi:hypothetical protein CRM22_011178 [Opisthorchis felineus]|uniref:F5/8 type C domain-containing protein n=1 Tax=Opisthorchis felineus TaxID=147828 RepID=A0A4S2K862_OPIFE|nr:hypothetical protein CRM22_011178 [Opisthorchis felineus]